MAFLSCIFLTEDDPRQGRSQGGRGQVGHAPTERENKINLYSKNKKKINWPGPKNSGPNPRNLRLLVGCTLRPRQVGTLLDEILATCLTQGRNILHCFPGYFMSICISLRLTFANYIIIIVLIQQVLHHIIPGNDSKNDPVKHKMHENRPA